MKENRKVINVKWLKPHWAYSYSAGETGSVFADVAPSLLKGGFILPAPDKDNDKVNPLPEDLPVRDLLFENGFETVEKIKEAGEAITDIKGIGKGTLKQLAEWFETHEAGK
jgi:hypothetical protein